jgi:hypothetical protein
LSEKLNGFRFISSKTPTSVSFRAEIWFDFNNDDTETLLKYKDIFETMFTAVGYEHTAKTVKFINMKGDEKKPRKTSQRKTSPRQVNERLALIYLIVCL